MIALFRYRSDKKIVGLFFGIVIYALTTALISFFAQAWKVTQYVTVTERIAYITLLSIILALVLFGVSKTAKSVFTKQNAPAIYAGYGFVNTFIYNMSSYGLLFLVGFFKGSDKLEQMYGNDYAAQLRDYFDSISNVDAVALILELLLTFYILYKLFTDYISGEKGLRDLLRFFLLTMSMYLIQFLSPNALVAFACYGLEALFVSGSLKLLGKNGK